MPNQDYTKSLFLQAMLRQQRQTLDNGGSLVNPSVQQPTELGQLAGLNTGVQKPVEKEKEANGFDQFMNNVLGFVDEIAAKFGAGFVGGWEGGLDLIATGLGALGWEDAAKWAQQDIGTAAAEWSKTALGLGAWYNRFRNWDWNAEEWKDIGESWVDWNKAAFFANTDMKDVRETLSDKHYKSNDEVLSEMNIGDFKAGEFLGGIAHSIGFMLPSIMTSGAASGAGAAEGVVKGVSLSTLGVGAGGKGSEEALNDGANAAQALGYGALSGGAEVLSEIAVGPVLAKVGLGTGKIMGVVGGKAVKATSKSFIKELAKSAFEEGMEEVSTALVEPLLKSIYKGSDALKDYGTKEFWFDGNESVLGQFASGAVTGGLMTGVSISQQNKTFGREGRNVVNAVAEARENYAKMMKYKEGSSQYNKYLEETLSSLTEAVDAWNKANGKLSDEQLKNLQQYIQNPGDFLQSMKDDRSSAEVISEYMNELKSGKDIKLDKFAGREIAKNIFKAVDQDGYSLKYGKVKNDANASISGKTITINDAETGRVGSLLAHEFGVHALYEAIGKSDMNKLYNSIVNDKWHNSEAGKSVQERYKNDANYKEEIVANYIQDMVESKGGTQTQLQYLDSIFNKPSFTQKVLRLFNKNIVSFPSESAIETEFRKIINRIVKSSRNSVYKAVIKKLQKGEKLNAEEATAYRSLKNVFNLFKREEAYSKNRNNVSQLESEETQNGKNQEKRFEYDFNKVIDKYRQSVSLEDSNSRYQKWQKAFDSSSLRGQEQLRDELDDIFSGNETIFANKTAIGRYLRFIRNEDVKKEAVDDNGFIKHDFYTPETVVYEQESKKLGYDVHYAIEQFLGDEQAFYSDDIDKPFVRISLPDVEYSLIDLLRHERTHFFQHKYKDVYINYLVKPILQKLYPNEYAKYGMEMIERTLDRYDEQWYDLIKTYSDQNYYRNIIEHWTKDELIYFIENFRKRYGVNGFNIKNYSQDMLVDVAENYCLFDEVFANIYSQEREVEIAINERNRPGLPSNDDHDLEEFHKKMNDFNKKVSESAKEYNRIVNNFTAKIGEEIGESLLFSKNRVLGNWKMKNGNSKLRVRRSNKGGYEIEFDDGHIIREAEVEGEWVNDNGVKRRQGGNLIPFDTEERVEDYLKEWGYERVEQEMNIDPRKIVASYEFEEGDEKSKSKALEDARKRVDELKAEDENSKYRVLEDKGKYVITRTIKSSDKTIDLGGKVKELDFINADKKKTRKIDYTKPIYINENNHIYELKAKLANNKAYDIKYRNLKTDELLEKKNVTPEEYRKIKKDDKNFKIEKSRLAKVKEYEVVYRGKKDIMTLERLKSFVSSFGALASNNGSDVKTKYETYYASKDKKKLYTYKFKRIGDNEFSVKIIQPNQEIITKKMTGMELKKELGSYKYVMNSKDEITKSKESTKKETTEVKKQSTKAETVEQNKKTILIGVKLKDATILAEKDGKTTKYVTKHEKSGKYTVKITTPDGKTTKKTMTGYELRKEINANFDSAHNPEKQSKPKVSDEQKALERARKRADRFAKNVEVEDIKNIGKQSKKLKNIAPQSIENVAKNISFENENNAVEQEIQKEKKEIKKVSYKSISDTEGIVDNTVNAIQKMLGDDYKVVFPINKKEFVNRTFIDVNGVKNAEKEAGRLVNKMLETSIETKDRKFVGYLEDLLDADQIADLKSQFKTIIETAPYSKARSIAERNITLQLLKAQAEAKEYKSGQSRTRVFTRIREQIRRNVGRFHEITNDEIIRSGLYTLLDPFEKLHGSKSAGFSAKDFRENIAKVLDWYTADMLSENYEGLIYDDAVRAMFEDLCDMLGAPVETANGEVYKNLTAEQMQKSIEIVRMINTNIKRMIENHTDRIAPSSIETKKAIARSTYGRRANVIAKLIRMYKRGFAPSYVLIEEILGGNSEAVKILVNDIQNGTNSKALYTGAYHDEINKKMKELGIKKTFDTKKLDFRGHKLSVDQLMGLYLSTKVEANYNAINEDGAVFYDDKNRKLVDLAGKGEAETLKQEIEGVLPDNYKKFANWLLDTMNDSVKAEYIEWFENKFGKYQMRNEIGQIKENSYWTLKRSYQKMDNISKAIRNPDALFTHALKRTKGGHNAVMITGALGTFDAYIDKLGKELFIKPHYEDALAVLNTKGIDGQSVMDTLARRNDGSKDVSLLREIMGDILGANQRQSNLLDKMVSAFSVAKLSLNIGSMAKQFASAFTSNIPISKTAKALVARWSSEAKAEFNKIFKEIGGLRYREANKGVLRANADSVGQFTENIARLGMIGISKVDLFTVSTGVYSLMVIGQDQYGYKIGSEENIKFVKDHWYEYELSQIGNTALSRNTISRSDSLTRYLFGFLQGANRAAIGSQIHKFGLWERNRNVDKKQLQNSLKEAKERLEKATGEYQANPDDESARTDYINAKADVLELENRLRDYNSYEIAGGKAIPVNMAAGIVAQGILVALVNALMKRIKGKKDWDELDAAEEGLALAMAIGVDWIPFVNFVSNIVQGYDVDIPATNLLNQFSAIFKSGANQNWDTMIRQMAFLVGDMTGIPFQTLYEYMYGALKTFDPEIAYEFRSVFYGSSQQSAMNTMKSYADRGKVSKTASMMDLVMNKFKTGSTNDEINRELSELYIAGYNAIPKAVMTSYTDESGNTIQLTAKQITQFRNEYSKATADATELMNITEYRSMTAEERAKVLKKLYDTYYNYAKAKVIGTAGDSKIANLMVLTNGNISLAKYILSLEKIGQITETNKKTRKELVLEYINKLRGYSRAEKALLMYLAGYKVSGSSETLLTSFLRSYGVSRKQASELFA